MKNFNINKVYYSTQEGNIECIKINKMTPEHISLGTIFSIEDMSNRNKYLILGFNINLYKINRKTRNIELKFDYG